MAEAELNIKVLVETGKIGELEAGVKKLTTQIKTAAREDIPDLIAKKQQLIQTINTLIPKNESLTQSIKNARSESRIFRFALLEMVHGLDGLGTAFGAITGAGDSTKDTIKEVTGAMQGGLGAGLGLKFGMEALGGTFAAFAGPVGIGVGLLTVLGSVMNTSTEAAKKQKEELAKLKDEYIDLEEKLGHLTRAQILNEKEAEIEIAKTRLATAQKATINWPKSFLAGFIVYEGATDANEIQRLTNDIDKAQLAYNNKIKEFQKEDEKGAEKHEKVKVKTLKDSLKEQEDAVDKWMADMGAAFTTFQEPAGKPAKEAKPEKPQTFEQQVGAWMAGISVLQAGFANMSRGIADGISAAFGEATSIFQMFVQGVMQGIAQIAEQLASSAIISGFLSLLGFGGFGTIFSHLMGFASGGTLYEPVVGMGASGRMYSFAENGPERFNSLTNFGGGGGRNDVRVSGEFKLVGKELVAAVKQSRVYDRMKGGNF